jgi:outer membrane murein-binding lipoprotein Lpp
VNKEELIAGGIGALIVIIIGGVSNHFWRKKKDTEYHELTAKVDEKSKQVDIEIANKKVELEKVARAKHEEVKAAEQEMTLMTNKIEQYKNSLKNGDETEKIAYSIYEVNRVIQEELHNSGKDISKDMFTVKREICDEIRSTKNDLRHEIDNVDSNIKHTERVLSGELVSIKYRAALSRN